MPRCAPSPLIPGSSARRPSLRLAPGGSAQAGREWRQLHDHELPGASRVTAQPGIPRPGEAAARRGLAGSQPLHHCPLTGAKPPGPGGRAPPAAAPAGGQAPLGAGEGREEAQERSGEAGVEGHPRPLTWQPFLWWKPTTTMCSTGPRFSMEQPGDGRAGGCRRARALAPPPGVRRGRSPGRLRFRTARPGRAGTALGTALRPPLPPRVAEPGVGRTPAIGPFGWYGLMAAQKEAWGLSQSKLVSLVAGG